MTTLRLLALLLIGACASAVHGQPAIQSLEAQYEEAGVDAPVLIVHYHRAGDDYAGWNLWSWADGAEGAGYALDNATDFGRYATIAVHDGAERQGLIVRKNEWEARDIQFDRWVELDDDGVTEIWLVAGNPTVFTEPEDVDLSVRLIGAFLDASDTVRITTSAPLDRRAQRGATLLIDDKPTDYRVRSVERTDAQDASGVVYSVTFTPPVAFEDVSDLQLALPGFTTSTVYARDVLDEPPFVAPGAVLGPVYAPESTTFRVWSPVSERVLLRGYKDAEASRPSRVHPLTHTGNGVWEVTIDADLAGLYYEYEYHAYDRVRSGADINAYAASADSQRSVVVDLDATDPAGFDAYTPPSAQPMNEIIYEVHVRDLSIRDTSLAPSKRGTYAGLHHRGTMTVGDDTVRTGLNHFEELGVTAVHLLPIHDFPTTSRDEYNWGYWTTLFNVPESNYATNDRDPTAPIRELKQAITGLHDADIRVILDVVYNHTSSSFQYSHFDNAVPYYYFRTTTDGRLRNDAGVGNSIADERTMVSKYISDSLVYWTNEYRVDGFRFDLIGTHQPESVRAWVERLRDIRPDLTIYGEPWTGGGPTYFPKGAQRGMGIAVFNDHFRNAIRGDLDGDAQGFANGPFGDLGAIRAGMMGAIDDFTDDPFESISYASAHDNLTLFDKITRVTPGASDDTRRDMQKLSHALVLLSQGLPFIHGGADFARTKGGNHNSYNAGDEVNKFDWPRKQEYRDVFDYIAGLIELRKSEPAFWPESLRTTRATFNELRTVDIYAFELDAGDARYFVAFNGSSVKQTVNLTAGGDWDVLVDRESAGTEVLGTVRGQFEMPPYSAAVLRR